MNSLLSKLGFHTHNWVTVGVTFTPPSGKPWEASGFVTQALLDSLTQGVTGVTQECTVCHKIEVRGYSGRIDIPGFTWEKQQR